jgi:signal transduction histidine kinase/PAS domain-containing protein
MTTNHAARRASEGVRLIFRQVPGLVWATDRELRVTYASGRTTILDAPEVEGLVGRTVYEFVGGQDPSEPAVAHHLAALAGGSQAFRYFRKNRWYAVQIESLRDDVGLIIGCVGSAIDVTEQHDTLQKLQRSVSLLEATLESTADGILVVDKQGKVTIHNERFATMWRVPPALSERGDDAALLSYVSTQLEEPGAFLEGVRGLYDSPREACELLRFTDGRVFERYSLPQLVAGEIVGRVWSFRDVTERERLLRRATFLDDATRVLASLDIKEALRSVARLTVPYLGERCAVDLIEDGKPERLIVAGADVLDDRLPDLHGGALSGHPVIYAAGSRSHMVIPLFSRDRVVGVLTFVAPAGRQYTKDDLDLPEELGRRAALSIDNAHLYEGAREALNGRDEFLSIAAHEIRGPLTSMHLAVQSLLRGTLPADSTRVVLGTIEREDRRLGRFVDELLDLGRIRTGQLHFELEDVDLGSVVRDTVSRHSAELAQSGSSTSVETNGHLVGEWDRFRLEQVVGNLLGNAIKFGHGQPIDITVVGGPGEVTLTVTDHGIGIEPDMLTRIFDPFHRAVAARHYGGLGLGLHIAKTIVDGLGGTIAVDSQPGQGTTFVVTLPISRSVPDAAALDLGRG